jgi:Spy/CpxP family protein refolding chaperone
MMRESFNSAGDDMRSKFREARETREELVKILSAETFDTEAYDKTTAHMNEIKQDIAANKARVARELALKLPAEDRRKMASNLVNGGEREGPRRGGRNNRGGMRDHGQGQGKGAESGPESAPAQ